MRNWPKHGFRRVEHAHSDVVETIRDVDNNLPSSVDMRADCSPMMNSLIVREGNSLTVSGDKPELIGLSYSREHYSIEPGHAYATSDSVGADTDLEDGGIRGVLPAQERYALGEAARAYEGRQNTAVGGVNPSDDLAAGENWISQVHGDGHMIGTHGLTLTLNQNGRSGENTLADTFYRTQEVRTDPRRLLQLLLTGRAGNANEQALTFTLSDFGVHLDGTNPQGGTFSQAIASHTDLNGYQTQAQRARLYLDKIALEHMPTSAMDFIYRWHEDLVNLSQHMGYFKSEFIGFFEKGQRAQFWQRFSQGEILLIGWLAQLGKAYRTGAWANNLHAPGDVAGYGSQTWTTGSLTGTTFHHLFDTDQTTRNNQVMSQVEHLAGCYNPFFMRLQTSAGTFEYMPWWIASEIDNATFENTYTDNPQYGIYQEDVFTGLDMLLNAASLEAGLAWRSVGKGYLEFFEDFKSAKLPDFRSNEARTSDKALKTLWHLGFDSVDAWFETNGIAPNEALTTAFFNDFTEGQLVVVDQQEILLRDLEELASLEIVNGPRFAEGMQLGGKSQFSVHHRRTTDGNSHSVNLNYSPECFVRPSVLTPGAYCDRNGTDLVTDAHHQTNWSLNAAGNAFSNEIASWNPGIRCLLWPSSSAGWHVYAEQVHHPRNHAFVDANGATGTAVNGFGFGYGVIAYPNDTIASVRVGNVGTDYYATTALFPEEHWRLGMEGVAVRLMRSMTQVYKHWQNRANLLPFKSQFKGLEFSGINLVSMLTMETGENLIQKNLPAILGIGMCSQNGNWSIAGRQIQRDLSNLQVHVRPQRWGDLAGADLIAQYLPKEVDETGVLDAFAMYNYLSYTQGILGRTEFLTAGGANTIPLLTAATTDGLSECVHPLQTEIHMYPNIGGGDIIGTNLRTIYIPATGVNIGMTEDGMLMSKNIILRGPLAAAGTAPMARTRGLMQLAGIAAGDVILPPDQPIFDFWTEEVVNWGAMGGLQNSAHIVPGARYAMDALWQSTNPNAAPSAQNSMCSLFGLLNTPAAAGSNVVGLTGYANTPNELQNLLGIAPAPAAWDSWLWAQYIETRMGELVWQEMQPAILLYDQDILDLDTACLSVLWFMNSRRLIHGYCPYMAIIGPNGEIKSQHENVFEITSGGGVATESGGFTESTGDEYMDDPQTVGNAASDRAED